eukprot:2592048-Rhodomonas_salina.6
MPSYGAFSIHAPTTTTTLSLATLRRPHHHSISSSSIASTPSSDFDMLCAAVIQEFGCGALCLMAKGDEETVHILRVRIPRTLSSIPSRSVGSLTWRERFYFQESKAVQLVQMAMKRHPQSPKVQQYGAAVIGAIAK